jgi:hypothetical protein
MPSKKIDLKPPQGMLTVMCDNKPIGYVKDTPDPVENARLGLELLKSKGLWKKIPIEKSMFDQAASFAHVANYVYGKDLKKLPRNPQGITPFVVNAAFSAEMYLKCIQQKYEKPAETHILTALFKKLPNKVKDIVSKYKKQIESQYDVEPNLKFKDHLKKINFAFENWHYIYEQSTEHVHIPTTIFVLDVLHQTAVQELKIET